MYQSIRHSQIVLRIGLALVFLWFGIDAFIEPAHWMQMWMPASVITMLGHLHLVAKDTVVLYGIFAVLVAVSLATGFFMRWFAVAAAIMLAGTLALSGFNEIFVQSVAIISALIALVIWPERTYI